MFDKDYKVGFLYKLCATVNQNEMKSEHQHFVPKSYLSKFCFPDKKELFLSKFIPQRNQWYGPQSKHIEQICYGPDLYDLHQSFARVNQVKQDHIERFAYWYENGFIDELIEGVNNGQFNEEAIIGLPKFYLSMISRNPVFRNALDEKQIETLIKEEILKIREKTAHLYANTKVEGLEELLNAQMLIAENELLSQNTKELIHNTTLFRQHFGLSESFESLVNMLLGYKILFIKINDPNKYFITSNAPGFSVDKWNTVSSFKFKNDVAHYMPISSKVAIAITHPVYFINNPKIAIVESTDDLILYINQNTFVSSNHEVYSEDKDTLNQIIKANNIN